MTRYGSDTTTHGIRVEISTDFLEEQSDLANGIRVFAYRVRISNMGPVAAKLLTRHWIITDGWGNVREVKGAGVVGHQPRLLPGEAFEYTSFCPLPTDSGTMRGTYQWVRDDGLAFDAAIGVFHLSRSTVLN